MTNIVPAPDVRLSSEFPTNADRVAGVFNAKTANWTDTSRTMAADMDAAAKSAATNAQAAEECAVAADQSAQDANQYKLDAQAARDSAQGAAVIVGRFDKLYLGPKAEFPSLDNEGGALQIGAEFFHAVLGARYSWSGTEWLIGTNVTAGVTQINGEAGAVILKTVGGVSLLGAGNIEPSTLYRSPRTSNVQLVASDKSKLIDITAGTFTQTFAAAATLGDGWFCYLRNSGTGDITLDPDGAEQIDGLASYVMYPGEVRLVQCDGAELRTLVLNAFFKTFAASGIFTKPPGYASFAGLLWGGGASGSRGDYPPGGGGGACSPLQVSASSLSSTETVVIGASATGPSTNAAGVAGNSSLFAGVTSGGGLAGIPSVGAAGASGGASYGGFASATNSGFSGGTGATAAGVAAGKSIYGGGGSGAPTGSGAIARAGADSIYGGGGGAAAYSSGGPYTGGASKFGGSGGAGDATASGGGGVAPGGGGGATISGIKAGDGARGELRIWGVI